MRAGVFFYVCSVSSCDRTEESFFGFKRSNSRVFRMYARPIFEVCMVHMFYRSFYPCWIRINIHSEKKIETKQNFVLILGNLL